MSLASTQTPQPVSSAMRSADPQQRNQHRVSDATASYNPIQHNPQMVTSGLPPELQYGGSSIANNQSDDLTGFLDLLNGPSFVVGNKRPRVPSFLQQPRVPSCIQPTFLQQQLDGEPSPSKQRWLEDLEDSIMSIPSQVYYFLSIPLSIDCTRYDMLGSNWTTIQYYLQGKGAWMVRICLYRNGS